jgi:TIR domain
MLSVLRVTILLINRTPNSQAERCVAGVAANPVYCEYCGVGLRAVYCSRACMQRSRCDLCLHDRLRELADVQAAAARGITRDSVIVFGDDHFISKVPLVTNLQARVQDISSPSLAPGLHYHAFLSHTWVQDEEGRDTHARVARLSARLKERGLVTWFDADQMEGDIGDAMSRGIDESAVFVVCLTKTYEAKVAGDNAADNCKKEFKYAVLKRMNTRMLPVVMEQCMTNSRAWKGVLGMELGSKLYCNLTKDSDDFEKDADAVYEAIVKMLA